MGEPWFLKCSVLTLVVLDPRENVHPVLALTERGHLELGLGLSRPHPVVMTRGPVLMLLVHGSLLLSLVMIPLSSFLCLLGGGPAKSLGLPGQVLLGLDSRASH